MLRVMAVTVSTGSSGVGRKVCCSHLESARLGRPGEVPELGTLPWHLHPTEHLERAFPGGEVTSLPHCRARPVAHWAGGGRAAPACSAGSRVRFPSVVRPANAPQTLPRLPRAWPVNTK